MEYGLKQIEIIRKRRNMNKCIFYLCSLAFIVLFPSCFGKNDNLCNLYVIDIMKEKNIYLPSSGANDIDIYLERSADWEKIPRIDGKLNHKAAYSAAKSGKYVLATYNGGKRSGHIAIVNGKKGMTQSKNYNAYVPYASGSVHGRKPELIPLSYQFSADKEPKMTYYIYKKFTKNFFYIFN
jgi:hypothetical protein